MSKQKFAFQICLTLVLFPNITSLKRQMQRQERTGHFHVNFKEEWNIFDDGVNNREQSNRQFTQDLRQWHKSSIEAEKNISQGSIEAYNTPNNCKPGTMSKQKFAFQICLTHVLFPNVTIKKRQMQRQERTGHFHVNSKEEWNMLYNGLINREQSNRQFTQDLRQWHKSSIEAEKITPREALDFTTRQNNSQPGKKSKKSPSSYVRAMCYSKHHKHKTSDAETGENRSLPRPLQRGVEHVLRWCG